MTKQVWVDEIGEITLVKRRGVKGLRLSVNFNGRVRVSMPSWVPYSAGVSFAKKRRDWIIVHKQKNQKNLLRDGAKIGKIHALHIKRAEAPGILRSRISNRQIIITTSYQPEDELVQKRAERTSERALLLEAEQVLPPLLQSLAQQHGFSYKSLRIRKLTSRWGSCSSDKIVTLSYFLVQLPDEFVRYVILHELVHTRHLNHSPDFWRQLEELVPGAKAKRRQMHEHKPRLEPST